MIDLNSQASEGVDKSDEGRKRSSVQFIKWKMLKLVAKKTVEKEQRDSMRFEEHGESGAARQDVTNSSGRNLEVVSEGAQFERQENTAKNNGKHC